jgi:hypothetical protein
MIKIEVIRCRKAGERQTGDDGIVVRGAGARRPGARSGGLVFLLCRSREAGHAVSRRADVCSGAEIGAEAVVRCGKFLGEDARLGHDGDKVGVTNPAGNDVHMEVVGDTCARGTAEVEAEVEAVGAVLAAEGGFALLGKFHELAKFFAIGVAEKGDVPVRDDQKMTRRVWKEVEDNVRVSAAI